MFSSGYGDGPYGSLDSETPKPQTTSTTASDKSAQAKTPPENVEGRN